MNWRPIERTGDLPIVPVFSSLSIPEDLVTYLTRRGIYALAMGDEAMQVLNLEAVRSRRPARRRSTRLKGNLRESAPCAP